MFGLRLTTAFLLFPVRHVASWRHRASRRRRAALRVQLACHYITLLGMTLHRNIVDYYAEEKLNQTCSQVNLVS